MWNVGWCFLSSIFILAQWFSITTIFPTEMDDTFESLRCLHRAHLNLNLQPWLLSWAQWMDPILCAYFYLETSPSPHPVYLKLGNSNRSPHKCSWFQSFLSFRLNWANAPKTEIARCFSFCHSIQTFEADLQQTSLPHSGQVTGIMDRSRGRKLLPLALDCHDLGQRIAMAGWS